MSEMLERVAKAIVFVQEGPCDPEIVARMAIEAMREPTTEIIDAFYREVYEGAEYKWNAMIDAALEGKLK